MNSRTEYKKLVGWSEHDGQVTKYEISMDDNNKPARFKVYMANPASIAHPYEEPRLEPVINMQISEADAMADDIKSMLDWVSRTGGLKVDLDGVSDQAVSFRYGSAQNR